MIGAAVTALLENARVGSREIDVAAFRRDTSRELERQVQRALWRAERRSRRLPLQERRGTSWVNAQRRKIAWELFRALRSLGAGRELARAIAAQACERFPRDGVVITETDPRKPRESGTSQRQRASNPRARGASPRQLGTSPRQRRAAADLSELTPAPAQPAVLVPPPSEPPPITGPIPTISGFLEQLASDPDLSPQERTRAQLKILERRRQEAEWRDQEARRRQQRESDPPSPTTDTRS